MDKLCVEGMLAALDRSVSSLPEAARPEALRGVLAFYAALHHNAGVAAPLWVEAGQARGAGARQPESGTCPQIASTG
jgi:hypothetical protein